MATNQWHYSSMSLINIRRGGYGWSMTRRWYIQTVCTNLTDNIWSVDWELGQTVVWSMAHKYSQIISGVLIVIDHWQEPELYTRSSMSQVNFPQSLTIYPRYHQMWIADRSRIFMAHSGDGITGVATSVLIMD